MRTLFMTALLACGAGLLVSGCSGAEDDDDSSSSPIPTSPTPSNAAPSLTIVTPTDGAVENEGELVGFSITVTDDQDVSGLEVAVFSSLDGELYSGAPATGGVVAFSKTLSLGQHSVTASVSDTGGLSTTRSVSLRINGAPTVEIDQPTDGAVYSQGETVTVRAEAFDADDDAGTLTALVTSSIDGVVATPTIDAAGFITAELDDLSSGAHVISVRVTDPSGARAEAEVSMTVSACLGSDADGDGFGGDPTCENPDCDDSSATVYPGAKETCNGVDDDCDREVDDGLTVTYFKDNDGDGYGSPASGTTEACTAQTGYVTNDDDCDDGSAAVNPGAAETCNGKDDNCDGVSDDGFSVTYYRDADGDGYGTSSATVKGCSQPDGYSSVSTDCDDTRSDVNPGEPEVCNGIDDNCDQQVDPGLASTFYRDADGDGYGTKSSSIQACTQPSGYSSVDTDCDDTKSAVNPGATEACNGVDDNCDGQVDPGLSATWYKDADKDGYGASSQTSQSCTQPTGYVEAAGDCDDTKAAVNPGAPEACNGIDDNCDGVSDDGLSVTYYRDADGDGYGSPSSTTQACTQPSGYASVNTDCDDADKAVHPGAAETCNGADENCDSQVDEGVKQTWYKDNDADGYGSSSSGSVSACTAPSGYVASATDCNDANKSVNPGATELCDAIDNDCDGQVDGNFDTDKDGFTTCGAPDGSVPADCDDSDATVYPGAKESCDGADNDCDGTQDEGFDADKDGYVTCGALKDCDDADVKVYPGATETCNSIDDDCDAQVDDGVATTFYPDADGDGYGATSGGKQACTAPAGYVTSNTDCDDSKASVKPGATETCNSVDDDCDGQTDEGVSTTWYRDADTDGYGTLASTSSSCTQPAGYVGNATDCNDSSAAVYPGATETCNSVDDDCDGKVDDLPGAGTFYKDTDNDGFGSSASGSISACTKPSGYAALRTDCDDASSAVYPGAPDTCGDGIDADCDGNDGCVVNTTDYYATSITNRVVGEASYDQAGWDVANAGDTDGDGFDDVLVSAPYHDAGGSNAGAVYLFLGPVSGQLDLSKADAKFNGEQASDNAGYSISGAGDVNGDGYADLLVGAQGYDETGKSGCGAAYIVFGPVTGTVRLTNAEVRLVGEAAGDQAGYSVAGAGDVNKDGFDDLLVGAPSNDSASRSNNGAVYLVLGSSSLGGNISLASAKAKFQGAVGGDNLGAAVSSAGDINGDGYSDILMGSMYADITYTDSGAVFLVLGSTLLSGSYDLSTGSNYRARFNGESSYTNLGSSLSAAGDIDGDGYDDIVLGASGYSANQSSQGAAYLVGGSTSLSGNISFGSSTNYLARLAGEYYYDFAGQSVSNAGDVNDDGFDDLVIGAIYYDTSSSSVTYNGAAYLVLGPVSGQRSLNVADLRLWGGDQTYGYVGSAVSSADLNADGYSDIVIGAYGYDSSSRTDNGAAWIWYGPVVPTHNLWNTRPRYMGEGASHRLGASTAGAGDVNGDGLQDFLVGTDGYDSASLTDVGAAYLVHGSSTSTGGDISAGSVAAKLVGEAAGDNAGFSVSSAGDVNGDGYSDLLVGAPMNDAGGIDAGAVYLVLGPVTGTVTLDKAKARFTGEKAGDQAGFAVAPAGDANGDGYGDLLIGANKYDDGSKKDTGAVYLVLGSPALTGSISLSTAKAKVIGELNFDYAGVSVASGDVNGDGKPDVVLGAWQNDTTIDSGAAYVLYGPLNGTMNLSAANVKLYGEATLDYAGNWVTTGDVNGDGYSDVLVGAPGADPAGRSGAGTVYLVQGSAVLSGKVNLSSAAAKVYGDQAGEALGSSVALGDLSGDGYADLVLGAQTFDATSRADAGAVYVITSPKGGLKGTGTAVSLARRKYVGLAGGDSAGTSVAIPGDVDGDGFADLVLGAPGHDKSAATNAGAAYLFPWAK